MMFRTNPVSLGSHSFSASVAAGSIAPSQPAITSTFPTDALFPARKFAKTLLDVLLFIGCLLFIGATALSFPLAIFLMLFCEF